MELQKRYRLSLARMRDFHNCLLFWSDGETDTDDREGSLLSTVKRFSTQRLSFKRAHQRATTTAAPHWSANAVRFEKGWLPVFSTNSGHTVHSATDTGPIRFTNLLGLIRVLFRCLMFSWLLSLTLVPLLAPCQCDHTSFLSLVWLLWSVKPMSHFHLT